MKAKHPLAIVVMPDIPLEATSLLEAMGHCLYTPAQATLGVKIDAIVGKHCWRMPEGWWLKDGVLSPYAHMMLKSVTRVAYPPAVKKGK